MILAVLLSPRSTAQGQTAPSQPQVFSSTSGQYVHQQWLVEDGLPVNNLTDVLQTHDGYLWIGSWDGLIRFDGVRFTVFNVSNTNELPSNRIAGLDEAPDRTLRIHTVDPTGVVQYASRRFKAVSEEAATQMEHDTSPAEMKADPGPWRHEGHRLFWNDDLVFEAQSPIHAKSQDREGNIWIATAGSGLYRLTPAVLTTFGEAEGLPSNVVALYEDHTGTLWYCGYVDDQPRLTRMQDGVFTVYPQPLLTGWFSQTRDGTLWIGQSKGPPLMHQADQRTFIPFTRAHAPGNPARALFEDHEGIRWYPLRDGGVRRDSAGTWLFFDTNEPIRSIRETSDGARWLLTSGDGLIRYHHGRFTPFTTTHGLAGNTVRGFYEDDDATLWIGTYGRGLTRLELPPGADPDDARLTTYSTQNGLYDDVIHAIVEDEQGRLWMSSNRGLFWVRRAELNAVAAGQLARVRSTSYDERDGMRNREANGGGHLPGVKDRQGRLWFATQGGLMMADPSRIGQSPSPPPVVIERVVAGSTVVAMPVNPLHLGAEKRDLEIEYTGLAFTAPEQVHFRYRLEGYDDAWRESKSRTAYYTRVPPGTYTFHVMASPREGGWNEEATTLSLTIAPYFYETRGFIVFSAMVALGLAWGAYQMRTRRLLRRQQELEALVDERTEELRAEKARSEAQAEALRALDEAKSRFFANITHEFRTPLTLIIGPLKSALAGSYGSTPTPLHNAHQVMLRNSQRLLRLINQILDLACVEAGHLTLETRLHDLSPFVEHTVQAFAPFAESQRLHLSCKLPERPVSALVDPAQFEKVLLNLLSNAIKFTEPGGTVRVTLDTDDHHARLSVTDSGIGIAPDQLPHLFDRFFQADTSITRTHEGSGIGLALVKELVELHDGRITVESTPGHGSTFTVRLPLALDEATPGANDQPDAQPKAPAPRIVHPTTTGSERNGPARPDDPALAEADCTTILIIDDNADVRAFVRSILDPPYRVLEAGDGSDGLHLARTALPDLIVSDVMMPRLDGFALNRALKQNPATDCIPLILLTARADIEGEVEGFETGADDYVTKPFEAEVLKARVAGLLATRQRLRARFSREGVPAGPAEPERSALEQRLRALVEAQLTSPDFNPEALAEAAAMSYSQLYRRLREEIEETPSQFIRRVRVEHAARLLEAEAGSVSEVAYAVGFNSLSYFNRAFRERFDTTPSEYLRTV